MKLTSSSTMDDVDRVMDACKERPVPGTEATPAEKTAPGEPASRENGTGSGSPGGDGDDADGKNPARSENPVVSRENHTPDGDRPVLALGEKTAGQSEKTADGLEAVHTDGTWNDEKPKNHVTAGCKAEGMPYSVFGVQYLPRRYNEKGEQLKRTLRRLSARRRSKSDGNLKSRLDPKPGRPLGEQHVHSVPEMLHGKPCPAAEPAGQSGEETEPVGASDELGRSAGGPKPRVEFCVSDEETDTSALGTESNRDERADPRDPRDPLVGQFPFENIVFSGGGSKGYAYIGALKALEDFGVLSQVRRVGGSSAGAICGGLLAVGCTPQEIADVFFCDIKWLFQDQKCACCFCLPKIWRSYGINPGLRFLQIYGEHIAKKVKNPDITFMELYQDYGRELCIVVTNLTRMCSEYCHWTTTPDLPIRQAVRISMAFPVMYEPVKCNLFGEEHLYMDGGTLDQYPVHCFDGPLFELNHNLETGQKRSLNHRTLGLYVVAEEPIDYKIWSAFFGKELPYAPPYLPNTKLAKLRLKEEIKRRKRCDKMFDSKKYINELKANPVTVDGKALMKHYTLNKKHEIDIANFGHYCKASLSTVLVSQRRLHVKPEDIKRTVAINCGYIGTNDYVLQPADREFMICCGYEHTRAFLQDYLKQHTSESTSCHMTSIQTRQRSSGTTHSPDGTTSVRTSKETQV